ncbi:MAG: hypothetical protein ACOC9O_03190, partial [Myxococcota bacterium]
WGRWGAVLLCVAGVGMGGCEDEGGGESRGTGRGTKTASGTGTKTASGTGTGTGTASGTGTETASETATGDGPEGRASGGKAGPGRAPEGGCAEVGDRAVVWPRPGAVAVGVHRSGFVVAGHAPGTDEGEEEVFVARVAPQGRPAPLSRATVAPPSDAEHRAAPGLLVDGTRAWVASVDGKGALGVARLDLDRPGAPLRFNPVAEGADTRFAPSLVRIGDGVSIAWVDGQGTPMRVQVTRVDLRGKATSTHEVTLEAMGAAAPVFVDGASSPVLVFIDPRAGMSPIVRVPMGSDGVPRAGRVALSVGQATEPPHLAAAATPQGVAVAYTAIGSGATTAVGLVQLGAPSRAPTPLVEGTGYGALSVAATALPSAALFVAEAPTARDRQASRRLHVRRVDAAGAGPALALESSTTATRPAVARRSDGTVVVAFATEDDVRAAFVRCDE